MMNPLPLVRERLVYRLVTNRQGCGENSGPLNIYNLVAHFWMALDRREFEDPISVGFLSARFDYHYRPCLS